MLRGRAVPMARRKKIKVVDLTATVNELLKEYGEDCYKVMGGAVKEIGDQAVSKLQSVSKFAPHGNPSGDYSKDWVADEFPVGRLKTQLVVHNEDHYRLTHLLENGHVSRNGTGRTFGRVPAYPHIAPVNDWANKALPALVKEKLNDI